MKEEELFAGRKQFTRDDCEFLTRIGVLEGRFELIDGDIIVKMGQNRLHAVVVVLLMKWLAAIFGADFVQCQLPIEVAHEDRRNSQPEPDASVLTRPATDFLQATPGPGDIRLVVEVSDTTLSYDLRVKSALYSRAGIPEYWILDPQSRRLVAQTEPDISTGVYNSVVTYSENEALAALSAPGSMVRVADLLPPTQPTIA